MYNKYLSFNFLMPLELENESGYGLVASGLNIN
jgi:hypothetical protein